MAKVKVVLSWSGAVAREVARTLRDWLPNVIQSVEPFMSEEDIAKGATWLPALQNALQQSQFGVICVTADNLAAEWLQFEAGAMWKAYDETRVCPFLFGLDSAAELKPPLGLFQACVANNDDDIFRLAKSINAVLPESDRLSDATLQRTFGKWLPELRERLAKISPAASRRERRSVEEISLEILETVRSIALSQVAWANAEPFAIGREVSLQLRRSKLSPEHQEMLDELLERMATRDQERAREREEKVKLSYAEIMKGTRKKDDDGKK